MIFQWNHWPGSFFCGHRCWCFCFVSTCKTKYFYYSREPRDSGELASCSDVFSQWTCRFSKRAQRLSLFPLLRLRLLFIFNPIFMENDFVCFFINFTLCASEYLDVVSRSCEWYGNYPRSEKLDYEKNLFCFNTSQPPLHANQLN